MEDNASTKQLEKLVSFILKEAEEKAGELIKIGKEESSIEKSNLIQTQKLKIMKEFEQKEKQVKLAKKIAYANVLNESRLRKLRAQQEQIGVSFDKAHIKLKEITSSQSYPALLQNLILQSLVHIDEVDISLACRQEDIATVEQVLPRALEEYKTKWAIDKTKDCKVVIDKKNSIKCSGGVVLSAKDGRIVCNNTLDIRLVYAYETSLPQIREILFRQ